MLGYKNWLETRSRFVFTLTLITAIFAFLGIRLLLGGRAGSRYVGGRGEIVHPEERG